MLKELGYKSESVLSGEEALKFLKDNNADVVLLDMMLGAGMNGRETYEKILTLYPDQKAIIVSGFSESDAVKATLQLGAGGFIKKPYSMDQLNRAVQEVLHPEK